VTPLCPCYWCSSCCCYFHVLTLTFQSSYFYRRVGELRALKLGTLTVSSPSAQGQFTIRSQSAHGQFTFRWPSAHGQFTIRSPSVHGQFTIRSPSAQGQFTIPSPSANGQFTIRSPSAHGPFTIRSPSANGQFTIRSPSAHGHLMVMPWHASDHSKDQDKVTGVIRNNFDTEVMFYRQMFIGCFWTCLNVNELL